MVGAKAGALAWILIGGAILFSGGYRPYYWSLASLCLWICYAGGRGHAGFQVSEMHQVAWGFASIAAFVAYLWRDPAFQVSDLILYLDYVRKLIDAFRNLSASEEAFISPINTLVQIMWVEISICMDS